VAFAEEGGVDVLWLFVGFVIGVICGYRLKMSVVKRLRGR
jgi:hypothetical protein